MINREAVALVRELIGAVAAFRIIGQVKALPRTRSGKTARKSIADLARSKRVMVRSLYDSRTPAPWNRRRPRS